MTTMPALHVGIPATADNIMSSPSLLEMPLEIVDLIVQNLDSCRDIVSCMRTSSLFCKRHLLDLLACSFTGQICRIVQSKAPLEVVQALYGRWRLAPCVDHLPDAAKGGHVDVVRWMCDSIAQDRAVHGLGLCDHIKSPMGRRRSVPSCHVVAPTVWFDSEPALLSWYQPPDYAEMPRLPSPMPIVDISTLDTHGHSDGSDMSRPGSPALSCDDTYVDGETSPRIGLRPISPDFGVDVGSPCEFECAPPLTVDQDADDAYGALSTLAASVHEACRQGHVAVVQYLVDACPLVHDPARLLAPSAVADAARRGHQTVVAFAHERWTKQQSRMDATDGAIPCQCPPSIARAAMDAQQHDVLGWMYKVGCRSFDATPDALIEALATSDTDAVDALTRALDSGNTRMAPDGAFARKFRAQANASEASEQLVALSAMMWTADASFAIGASATKAATNCATILPIALVLSRGFTMAGAHRVFAAAAAAGNLSLFKWASGEAIGYYGERLAAPHGLPWNHPSALLEAACQDRLDIVQWLSHDSQCRSCLNPILARTLLATRGMGGVLRWLHTNDLAPMHTWDALDAAILYGQLDTVKEVADLGGVYTASVLVDAVRYGNRGIVAFLCQRYGTHDAQAAVDAWIIAPSRRGGIEWIMNNVPDIDVTDVACALNMIDEPKDPFVEEHCRMM